MGSRERQQNRTSRRASQGGGRRQESSRRVLLRQVGARPQGQAAAAHQDGGSKDAAKACRGRDRRGAEGEKGWPTRRRPAHQRVEYPQCVLHRPPLPPPSCTRPAHPPSAAAASAAGPAASRRTTPGAQQRAGRQAGRRVGEEGSKQEASTAAGAASECSSARRPRWRAHASRRSRAPRQALPGGSGAPQRRGPSPAPRC